VNQLQSINFAKETIQHLFFKSSYDENDVKSAIDFVIENKQSVLKFSYSGLPTATFDKKYGDSIKNNLYLAGVHNIMNMIFDTYTSIVFAGMNNTNDNVN
jgi:hypothetical protein